MNEKEFDQFAEEYNQTLSKSISISGESPDFFSMYKINDVKRRANHIQITPKKILDFGCGVGSSIPYLKHFFPNAHITGVDISRKSLDVAESRYLQCADFIQFDGTSFDRTLVEFDLIFSACVFHHIPAEEHERLFAELRRIANPGALLAIFEHNPWNPLTVRTVNSCPFDVNAKLMSAETLRRCVTHAGWAEVLQKYCLFFPHCLSLLRPLEHYMTWLPLGAQYVVYARAK
jgi:trans-aconitate methyltransferase